jgi:hypothetical protein
MVDAKLALGDCRRMCSLRALAFGLLVLAVPLGVQARKVIRLEEFKVEGRIQKPEAFYILQRSSLNFEGLELKKSFVPRIAKTVHQELFD